MNGKTGRKKVLFDLYLIKYPNCGMGQLAVNYARYFREQYTPSDDFDIYVIVPSGYEGICGDKVRYITGKWWKKFLRFTIPFMDVWHSTDQMPRFVPYSKDTKYILTIHDFNYEYEKNGAGKQHDRIRLAKRIERADYITCISNFTKSECYKFADVNDKPISVIYDGVEFFDDKTGEKPAMVDEKRKFFFTIGEIREKKNFHVLLDMMKQFPDRDLFIAGNPNFAYNTILKNRIEQENITNVHLMGKIANEERIWLYRNCEAFMFPSLFEGFGLPVIEAMQFGKPVFSSRCTSLSEIGGECAIFWDNFEPDHMVETVRNGLKAFDNDPSLRQRNIDYAHTYSYKRCLESYFDLYRRILSEKK